MASDEIERLHEPRGKRAVTLRAQPDPAVTGRAFGPGELRRKAARRLRADTGLKGNPLWRELTHQRCQRVEVLDATFETAGVDHSLRKHHMQHRGEQERVGSRPNRDMLVGCLGRLGPPRIDDNHTSPAIADRTKTTPHVRSRHQAAIRHDRVGAEDEEEICPIEIRDRDERLVATHAKGDEHLRNLIG